MTSPAARARRTDALPLVDQNIIRNHHKQVGILGRRAAVDDVVREVEVAGHLEG